MSIFDDLVSNLVERNVIKLSGTFTITLIDGGMALKGHVLSTVRDQKKSKDVVRLDAPLRRRASEGGRHRHSVAADSLTNRRPEGLRLPAGRYWDMSDVNTFIEAIGKDVTAVVAPRIGSFAEQIIREVFARYRPELQGELHARIVQGGLEVTGRGVRLDVKNRETGASVSVLDIPVSLTIKVDPLGVTLQNATINLDVVS
jgi:hypothetical protein